MPMGPIAAIDGGNVQLHYFTGKVLASQKQKETHVSGHGYGDQFGSRMRVSSETIDHHEFFLADEAGTESAFKMTNWDFPLREGQTLSVVWAIADGQDKGPYVHVRNHNTGDIHRTDVKIVAKQLRPANLNGKILGIVLGGFVLIGVTLGWGLAFGALLAAIVYGLFMAFANSRKAARSLFNSSALADLDAQLARVKPIAI